MATCRSWHCVLRPVPGTKHCFEHQTPQERLAVAARSGAEMAKPVRELPPPRTPEDGLFTAAGFVYAVAVLTLAAAVVAGIALILHKDTSCPSNPFDSSVDFACGGATYPFRGAGVAILIGGVVQAGLWFVLARVTHQLSQVRAATRVLLVRSGLGLRGEELD